jgi:hypothetical protein
MRVKTVGDVVLTTRSGGFTINSSVLMAVRVIQAGDRGKYGNCGCVYAPDRQVFIVANAVWITARCRYFRDMGILV